MRPRSRRPFRSRAGRIVVPVLLGLLGASPAAAQVCGDATGDGVVTVTDGVQALRAAAQLESACALATCDVDGSGSITVTDGVNVLRKAAGLSAPDACPGGAGPDAEVEAVAEAVAPLLLFAFGALSDVSLPGPAASKVAPAGVMQIDEDDCPDGGVRRKVLLGGCIVNVSFDACRYSAPTLGRFEFENTIAVNFCRGEVVLGFQTTDLDSGRTVDFDGVLTFTPTGNGFVADGGPIRIVTPQGAFDLSFQQLVVDDEGRPQSGSGQVTDTDDNFALQTVTFTVTGTTTASVVALFDDGTQSSFALNLVTGSFTPA